MGVMDPLELAQLRHLTAASAGVPEMVIGLIDGPVDQEHPALKDLVLRRASSANAVGCATYDNIACQHGTFVAGILFGNRQSSAPGLCPRCTALLRPIFMETGAGAASLPVVTPEDLADAIVQCVSAGARILNLSLAVLWPSPTGERALTHALDLAARSNVIVVAAAGNQANVGGSVITRHPWVIPVVGCNPAGRPLGDATLGGSIGRQGLRAPGDKIESLAPKSGSQVLSGSSAAAPFVTGTAALLWSMFPSAAAAEIKLALTGSLGSRTSIVPNMLDGSKALAMLQSLYRRPAA